MYDVFADPGHAALQPPPMTTPADFCGPTLVDARVILPPSVSVTTAVALLAEVLHAHPGVVKGGWTLGTSGRPSTGTLDELQARLGRAPEPAVLSLDFASRGLAWVLIKRHQGVRGRALELTEGHADCLVLSCQSGPELGEPGEVQQALACQSAIVDAFCDRFDVLDARLRRIASRFVPNAPLAGDERPMTVVSRRDVEDAYADPAAFWRSWDTQRELRDGRVLLTRALGVLDERDFKRAVYPRIWQLVHAARPGRCSGFDVADLWPQDLPYFEEGEGFLRQLGYDAGEQSIEFTAAVPAGQHLLPREIMLWARHLSDGRLPSGEPLRRVKFTFVDAAMAAREKRPLLDAGIEVWCYTPDARLVQVRD